MPSKKRKNGTFRDIAHPLNNETRKKIEEKVLARYREILSRGGASERSDDGTRREQEADADARERPDERPPA